MNQKWIVFLRGVNVSGKNKLNMKEFTVMLEDAGFKNVQTYIQSGNAVFETSLEKVEIETKVEAILLNKLETEVPVFLIQENELAQLIENNPFLKNGSGEPKQQYVTFFKNPVDLSSIELEKYFPDELISSSSICYLNCLTSYGSTKLNTTFLEKKLNQKGTTRNWNTLQKMLTLLSN
jgi:uncharacterized protein (DUF1697 family)